MPYEFLDGPSPRTTAVVNQRVVVVPWLTVEVPYADTTRSPVPLAEESLGIALFRNGRTPLTLESGDFRVARIGEGKVRIVLLDIALRAIDYSFNDSAERMVLGDGVMDGEVAPICIIEIPVEGGPISGGEAGGGGVAPERYRDEDWSSDFCSQFLR